MSIFNKKKNEEYTIVVGCGRLGSKIANTLSEKEANVLIIDKSNDSFRRLSSEYGGLSVVGDGMDIEELKNANIEKATVLVAVTDIDNVNIMVAQMAKEIFNIPKVIARLYDPEKKKILEESGIQVVCPAMLSANEVNTYLSGEKELTEDMGA